MKEQRIVSPRTAEGVALAAILLVFFFILQRTLFPTDHWSEYRAELITQGEKLDRNQFIIPIPPAENNFAALPFLAQALDRSTPNPEGWVDGLWTDDQLEVFQDRFLESSGVGAVHLALQGERANVIAVVEQSPANQLAKMLDAGGTPSGFERTGQWVQSLYWTQRSKGESLFHYTQLIQETLLTVYAPSEKRLYPARAQQAAAQLAAATKRMDPGYYLARVAIPNASKAYETAGRTAIGQLQAGMTCALARYHRTTGHYPRQLYELVPSYLSQIPRDPITGEIMLYETQATNMDFFTLYSVGWDEKDDRGDPALDWVWPAQSSSEVRGAQAERPNR